MPGAWPHHATRMLHRARCDMEAMRRAGWLLLGLIAMPLTLLCVVYWQAPNDLIPDNIPIIGRLDDAGVIVGSFALLRQVASRLAELSPEFQDGRPGLVLALGRAMLLSLVAGTAAPFLYRALLGRWPSAEARRCFAASLCRRDVPLPPLLRGLAGTPSGTAQIRALLRLAPTARDGTALLPPPAGQALTIAPLTGDPLCYWHGRRTAFLHIEKSAGTSVLGVLTAQFHPAQIDPDPLRTMPPHLLHRLGAQADTARAHFLVWGHYDLPYLQMLGPDWFVVLFLREPRSRILSLYHYWRSVSPAVLSREDGNHTIALAHASSLEEFLTSTDPFLVPYLDNCYARRLIGAYEAALPKDALARARAAISSIAFVGTTETIDRDLGGLAAALGFGRPARAPRANVTAEIAHADPRFRLAPPPQLTPLAEAALTRLTAIDQILYQEAQRRSRGARP